MPQPSKTRKRLQALWDTRDAKRQRECYVEDEVLSELSESEGGHFLVGCVEIDTDKDAEKHVVNLEWADSCLEKLRAPYIDNSRSNTYKKKAALRRAAQGIYMLDYILMLRIRDFKNNSIFYVN